MALLLETVWGDLVIDLDVEGSPELCKNFLKLAKIRFYTNTLLAHTVLPNRFCQAGDPVGDGTGGACIYGLLDTDVKDYHQSNKRFLKSVGRPLSRDECREKGRVVATCLTSTKDTIGSQFLITTAGGPDHALDGYSLGGDTENGTTETTQFLSLGVVTEDENGVLDKINSAYCDAKGRPYADIRIIRALVVHDPFNDIPGMDVLMEKMGVQTEVVEEKKDNGSINTLRRVVHSPSPERPSEERVAHRISASEVQIEDDSEEGNEQEVQRKLLLQQEQAARKEEKSRAVVLEMLGDLPSADIKAPEDVLFICKLNSVTVDEDLELILSRFDEHVKVEIIRDPETGASLQYAFAEFSNKQAAIEAYFKMNNALIDDRRIKVDFSQSVAKLWDKYNQKMRMPAVGGLDGRSSRGGRGGGRGGGGRGGGRGPRQQFYSGRGPPQHRDRIREPRHDDHSRRHPQHDDRRVDDFGRSPQFRRRHQSDDQRDYDRRGGHGDREHHSHGRHGKEERGGSRDGKREGRKTYDDDRREDRRERKRQKKEKRRHRDPSSQSETDSSAGKRKHGRNRSDSRERRRDYNGDSRDYDDDDRRHGSNSGRKKDRQSDHDGHAERDSERRHRHHDRNDSREKERRERDGGRDSDRDNERRRHRDRDDERRRHRRDSSDDDESDDRRHRRKHKKRHHRENDVRSSSHHREDDRHHKKRHRRSSS